MGWAPRLQGAGGTGRCRDLLQQRAVQPHGCTGWWVDCSRPALQPVRARARLPLNPPPPPPVPPSPPSCRRARYGFSQAPRPGCCRICGERGHWARDCERNPEVQQARERVVEPLPRLIAAAQRPGTPTALPGGASLVRALAGCLEAAAAGAPPAADYRAALCGEVQHYGSTLFSAGWGCGYNNMQMLASHLLAARPVSGAAGGTRAGGGGGGGGRSCAARRRRQPSTPGAQADALHVLRDGSATGSHPRSAHPPVKPWPAGGARGAVRRRRLCAGYPRPAGLAG